MCIQSVSRKKTGKWKIPSITQDEHLGEEGPKNKNRGGMGNVDGDDRGCRKEEIKGKGRAISLWFTSINAVVGREKEGKGAENHGKCKLYTKRTCVMYHFLPIASGDCNGSIST